jgi:hypothetical protein
LIVRTRAAGAWTGSELAAGRRAIRAGAALSALRTRAHARFQAIGAAESLLGAGTGLAGSAAALELALSGSLRRAPRTSLSAALWRRSWCEVSSSAGPRALGPTATGRTRSLAVLAAAAVARRARPVAPPAVGTRPARARALSLGARRALALRCAGLRTGARPLPVELVGAPARAIVIGAGTLIRSIGTWAWRGLRRIGRGHAVPRLRQGAPGGAEEQAD